MSFLIDDVLYHVILWWQFGADCLELFGCEFLQPVRIEAEHSESLIFKSGRLRYSVIGQKIMHMSVAVPVVHIGMERGKGIEVDGNVRVGFPAFRILLRLGFKSYIQIIIVDILLRTSLTSIRSAGSVAVFQYRVFDLFILVLFL